MRELNRNEKAVMDYLEGKDWTSPTEIGEKVLGKPYASATSSASPICKRLVKRDLLERNLLGQYRICQ